MVRDVAVVHPGVQHSSDLAASLDSAGRLAFLATRLQLGAGATWPWSRPGVQKRLTRRINSRLPDSRIRRLRAGDELLLRGLSRRMPPRAYRLLDLRSTSRFIDATMAALGPDIKVVIGTDTASLALFRRLAVERPDVARVLDVSHPLDVAVQPLIRSDAAHLGLDPTAYDDFHPGPPKDQRAEIELADVVLVASQFSESTFGGLMLPPGTVQKVPYAVDVDVRMERTEAKPDQPLRVLALGAMSERKGMSVLLSAMSDLERRDSPIRLTIAGRASTGYTLPSILPANTSYIGAPSADMVRILFASSDVLVLPSMCEGFGRTLLEALAAGMAVVTTERSGGPDIIESAPFAPVTIVPARSRDELLAGVLADHANARDQFIRPGDAVRAAECFSAASYVAKLEHAIAVAADVARSRETAPAGG